MSIKQSSNRDIEDETKKSRGLPIDQIVEENGVEIINSDDDDVDASQTNDPTQTNDASQTNNATVDDEVQIMNSDSDDGVSNNPTSANPTSANPSNKSITLQLGDVIVLRSPNNAIYNKRIFLIEYIDKEKIKIVDTDNFSNYVILINPDGTIEDENIQSITIISTNPEKGYARQNQLLPDTWINIHFGGDLPSVITGLITNLENDMIEIRSVDGDVFYINFNYQGIPENLPIIYFEIRNEPTTLKKASQPQLVQEQPVNQIQQMQPDQMQPDQPQMPRPKYGEPAWLRLNENEFTIGDLIQIEEIINVDDSMRRYNLEEQTNDFFEDLISTVPNNKRTSTIINDFNLIVKRFVELRKMSSVFDKYGNVQGPIIHSAFDIPLADYLSEFKNKLYWIKYGVLNNRSLYLDEESTSIELSNFRDVLKSYRNNEINGDQNNYHRLFNLLTQYTSPFSPINLDETPDVFSKPQGLIINSQISDEINAIDSTEPNNESQVVRSEMFFSKIRTKKNVFQQYSTGLNWLVAPRSKSGRMTGKIEKLTPNESICVNSIFTFPEPVVRFSQINLPNSNLLVKANLSQTFIQYSQLLKNTTPIKQISVNNLAETSDLLANPDEYLNNEIKQFSLNLTSFEKSTEITNAKIFNQFIKLIVPSTSKLFEFVQKYITGTLSPQNTISYLEPFIIYSNNLTFTQYKNISKFVSEKIKEYNTMFQEYQTIFNFIKNPTRQKFNTNNLLINNLPKLLDNLTREPLKSKSQKPPQSSVWREQYSEKYKRPFWYNTDTKESVWEKPATEVQRDEEEPEIQINFFNEDMKEETYKMYEFDKENTTSSESLKNMITKDYGTLFNTLVSYTNLKLMFSNRLNKLFEKEKTILKQIIEEDRQKNTCETYVIAKKYYSLDKMIDDGDIDIYFDKEYDKTNYDIVEEKFKKEKNSMSKEDFMVFIIPKLQKMYKLSDENSEYLAETLTNGLKKVLDGHYALLSTQRDGSQHMDYYIRNDDKWNEVDEDMNLASFVKDDDVLCNINYDCLYEKNEGKCVSMDLNEDNTIEKQFKGILDQFDEKYELSMDELSEILKNKIVFNEKKFRVLDKYNKNEMFKYNNIIYKLGRTLNKDDLNTVVSPHAYLKELILGQNDYAKKQQNIIQFIDKYCRRGISTVKNEVIKDFENEWWFYCKETNVQLMPYFRYELAKVFIENPSEYQTILDKLIKEIGKQSDDGDSWVDKHSGEVMCKIDFDISEGFKDGFVNKSREIIEAEGADLVTENLTNKQYASSFKSDINTQYLYAIFITLEGALGVELKQQKEFILKIGTTLMQPKSMNSEGIMLTKNEYNDYITNLQKKGKTSDKKLPSYELYYSMKIMYLALGLFAVGLQITIPSIKTRKIAPKCTKSFQGFPLGDSTDDSFIKYISCAIKSHRNDSIPWMAIEKNEDKMVPVIIKTLNDHILTNVEMNQKILKKIEYLTTTQQKTIPDEYNILKWNTFLPPLVKFHIKSENSNYVDDNFFNNLKNNILSSNKTQYSQINVINSKIIYQSLAIQEEIQNILDKKELIMKSSSAYYMINSCCNDITDKNTLEYFINESNQINEYNKQIQLLSNHLRYINYLCKAPIFRSDINTKRTFPEISDVFSEETIYKAFITFCKFNTLSALPKNIMEICVSKPNYLSKGQSIQEQIFQLKKDGRIYEMNDFIKLYKIVASNNIVDIPFNERESPNDEIIGVLQKALKKKHLNSLSHSILDNLVILLDPSEYYTLYENDTDIMKNIKNQLEIENDKMINEIIQYVNPNVNSLSKKKVGFMKQFLSNLRFSNWNFNSAGSRNNNISNDKLANYVNYMSNFIDLFANTFPQAIMQKKMHDTIAHKYWKLSKSHTAMIFDATKKFYTSLHKFYGDECLFLILRVVGDSCKYITKLSESTYSMSSIFKDVKLKKSFDEEISSLIHEYYLLCVFKNYMIITEETISYVNKDGVKIDCNVLNNKKLVCELFLIYFDMMSNLKKYVDITYDSIADDVFKNKEFEKNLVTDRLAKMTQEERDVDTLLKGLKLGMYAIGESKALRFYDEDQFEEDKTRNEKIAKLEKKLKTGNVDDTDVQDDDYNENADDDERRELAMNEDEDYQDGDPFGDERDDDNYDDYE
jgi:hypothetical protein